MDNPPDFLQRASFGRKAALEDDYRKAVHSLRAMNDLGRKVTAKARHRIAAHTLAAQLEAHLEDLKKEFPASDQADVETAFEADKTWSGQHARLTNSKGWDTSIEP